MRRDTRNPNGFAELSTRQRIRTHRAYQRQEFGVSDAMQVLDRPSSHDCERCRAGDVAVSEE